MTPQALLEKLESLGTIEEGVLKKLRRTVENPEKDSSVNKILTFLVKNDYLSKKDAIELKREAESVAAVSNVENRTDELTAGVLSSSNQSSVKEVDEAPEYEAEVAEIVEVHGEPEIIEHGFDQDIAETILHEPAAPDIDDLATFADPMAAPLDQFSSSKVKRTFAGKIDSSDQWATKWIFIGFATLGFLLMAGTLLFFFLSMISAVERFEAATTSFENGTYGDAIKKFEEFIEKHPSHEKIPLAKVKLVQSLLADTFKQRNWDETIVRAEKHLPKLLEDDQVDLEPIRQDLAVILPNTTLEMAKRATKQETKSGLLEQLDKAKNARKLVDNPVYVPNSKRKQANIAKVLDDIEEEIAKGDGLIQKQDDFDEALSKIATHRSQGETDKAFAIYNELIRDYGDLRANEQLQNEMKQVSQFESKLVKVISPTLSKASAVRGSPINSSVILASQNGTPIESLRGEIVPFLVDGAVFGIDVGDGAVVWRHHVGYQTDLEPVKVEGNRVLISDAAQNDLILVDAADGSVLWRIEVGEPYLQPQLVDDLILLTTKSGKLMKMFLESGEISAASQIPQSTNVPMVASKRTNAIVQSGFYSNLYVLSGDDLSCQDVIYLGHNRGSIVTPPVVWNNMVLVAVNQSGVCDLHVLGPTEAGVLEPVQRIRRVTRGIVTNPIIRFGRFMLITSESGDIKILELNTADENSPVRILAEEKFENSGGARIHQATGGSQLWIGAEGITRYKVSRALGVFERQEFANTDDFFTGPIRKFGDAIVHLRKRSGSAQTSVSAVDSITLEEIWRTDFGGPLVGPPILDGKQIVAISSQGDLFKVAEGRSTRVSKASSIDEELIFDQMFELSPTERACLAPGGRPDLLYVDIQRGTTKLMRLPPPADVSASPAIQIGGDLIIPSRLGQVVRIDPKTARVVGTPFLPPVRPGDDVNWQKPVVVGDSHFVVAADKQIFLIDASDKSLLKPIGELATEGVVKSPLASNDDQVYTVVAGKPTDKLISISTRGSGLQPGAGVDLGALALAGPWTVGKNVLVRMGDNSLVCFDETLSRKWAVDLGAGMFGEDPTLENDEIRLIFSDGRVRRLNMTDGSTIVETDLGQPIVHGPIAGNGGVLFSGRDGTIHEVQLAN